MRYAIYPNPRGVHGWTRWMNYAAKHDADLSYDAERRTWFTEVKTHADYAERCGMLVASIEEVPFQ